MDNVNEFIEQNGFLIHLQGSEERGFTSQLTIDSSLLPDPRKVDNCWGAILAGYSKFLRTK